MSNITFNFNAPIHTHITPGDTEDIRDLMNLVSGFENMICEMEDRNTVDKTCTDKSDEEPGHDPMAEGIPMILCFIGNMPVEISPEMATAIAKDAILHILNHDPHEDGIDGRA